MNSHELRKKYLEFLKEKGHAIVPSASLIPENDPTTLFTGSGMQPMVPYLLGEEHPLGKRIADSQKCFRAQDIEEVGDSRHSTFFEMLGNWSLGDYFKAQQIPWIFEFLTKVVGLDSKNLYITVFRGKKEFGIPRDDESVKIWQEVFAKENIEAKAVDFSERDGMQDGRIFYYDESKNWWSRSGVTENMPIGEPGGPDSEIFWDFGEDLGLHENSSFKDKPCHVNCDCGRFVEIGNNVFMQYIKTKEGFEPLPKNNVDFGGGLERIAVALKNKPDIFLIDIYEGIRKELENLSGKEYTQNEEISKAFRIVMDHLKAATFLICDGALPSNKDQGYFTRRLIRRAVRYGRNLGINDSFCINISKKVIEEYKETYPVLEETKDFILTELEKEEKKFAKTLEKGLKKLNEFVKDNKLSGENLFDLFQSYGFPLELSLEVAQEKNIELSPAAEDEFNKLMEKHQALSRKGAEQKFKGGLADAGEESIKFHTATHLLHQALRQVLGDHVEQKGSNITAERLRFDFSHGEKMTKEQIEEVENIVNQVISDELPVSFEEMSLEEAKELGAIGLFEDKYGDKVKVYTVGNDEKGVFSREICGGPHVGNTLNLGKFKIKKEESSSAGIRRIKALLK